jgi:hypothetical protein
LLLDVCNLQLRNALFPVMYEMHPAMFLLLSVAEQLQQAPTGLLQRLCRLLICMCILRVLVARHAAAVHALALFVTTAATQLSSRYSLV